MDTGKVGTGEVVVLGGESIAIRPLTLKQIKALMPVIEALRKSNETVATLDAMLDAVIVAISKDHPDKTREILEDCVTYAELQEAIGVIAEVSGLNRRKDGSAPASGEAQSEDRTS